MDITKKINRVAAFSAFLAAGLVGVTASAAPRTEVVGGLQWTYETLRRNSDNVVIKKVVPADPSSAVEGVVAIPSTFANGKYRVTSLGKQLFSNNLYLEGVEIPSTVSYIGWNCFYRCQNLRSIKIPAAVVEIENGAFNGCKFLKTVEFEQGSKLARIGNAAFANTTSLTGVEIPESVTVIGSNAFSGSGILRVLVPDSVKSLGNGAFSDCAELETAVIGSRVTVVDSKAFSNCKKLQKVVLKSKYLSRINWNAFFNCKSLMQLETVRPMVEVEVNASAFKGCPRKF